MEKNECKGDNSIKDFFFQLRFLILFLIQRVLKKIIRCHGLLCALKIPTLRVTIKEVNCSDWTVCNEG